LFGQEIRALSSVTFDRSRKVTRWVDYWDGRSSLTKNTIASTYPADFRDSEQNADSRRRPGRPGAPGRVRGRRRRRGPSP